MKKSWTNGLDKDLALEVRQHFTSSLILRKRLVAMLLEKDIEFSREGRSKGGYDCPNWAYKQADSVGYSRALHEIIALIEK